MRHHCSIIILIFAFTVLATTQPIPGLSCKVISNIYDATDEAAVFQEKALVNMARNEYEGFQLKVDSGIDKKLNISLMDSYIDDLKVEVFKLGLFQQQVDVLVPYKEGKQFLATAGKSEYFYVRFFASKKCSPGKYRLSVKIEGENTTNIIPVAVTVYDAIIPEATTIPYVFGIFDRAISGRYRLEPGSELCSRALMQYYRMLQEYKLSPYFCDWVAVEESSVMHHAYPSPYSLTDKRTLEIFKDQKQAAIAVPFHSLTKGTKDLFVEEMSDKQLRSFYGYLEKEGLDKKAYFYIYDEPHNLDHYAVLKQWAQKLYSIKPEAKVLTTYFSGPYKSRDTIMEVPKALGEHTQIHCLSYWATNEDESILNAFKDEVKRVDSQNQLWMYTTRLGYDVPGVNIRSLPWKMYKDRVKGYLYWAANPYVLKNTPYEEPETFVMQGKGFTLIHPREVYMEEDKDVFIRPNYLSFNKKVTASGESSLGHTPEFAVDGDWAHPKCGWWGRGSLEVDLEKVEKITTIQVVPYNRGKRVYRYIVEVSKDQKQWTQVVDMRNNAEYSDRNGFEHKLESPVYGRYVKLNVLGSNINGGAHICEFIVRGEEKVEIAQTKYNQNTDFTPLASIRLERFRDGIEDYELLQLYSNKYGSQQSLKLLEKVYKDPKTFTDSSKEIEEMRKVVLKRVK